MSFSLDRTEDTVPLLNLQEEPKSSDDTQTDVSIPTHLSSANLQTRSALLFSSQPVLSSWPSFTSTLSSTSTACSSVSPVSGTSSRIYKSKLTPDDFLLHAFGTIGTKSTQCPSTPSLVSSTTAKSSDLLKKSTASSLSRINSSKEHTSQRRYSLPAPPPSGTFKTTKPPKTKNSERPPALPLLPSAAALSVTEMDAFSGDLILPREDCSKPNTNIETKKREPLMTDEQWREKVRERAERRKQRHLATQQGKRELSTPFPIDIDWRPLEGYIGLPDPTPTGIVPASFSRMRVTSHKGTDTPKGAGTVKPEGQVYDDEELYPLRAGLNMSRSMDNLDDLASQCATITLSDRPQST